MNDYKRPTLWNSIPPVVKNIIIINLILWLATEVFFQMKGLNLNYVLGMHYWGSDKFNFTQMITYMFMHGGFSHFFFNMFAVFMFGGTIERAWGSKRFLLYYLVTGIGAGIIQQIVWTIDLQPFTKAANEMISASSAEGLSYQVSDLIQQKQEILNKFITVGASGAVFGLLLAYGMMFPNSELFIMFIPIPIKAKYFVIFYGIIELFLGVSGRMDGIAHFAHLGGMLFGIIMILYWKKKGNFYN